MVHGRLMVVMVLLCGLLASGSAFGQTVLFDIGHGERFTISATGPLQLSRFAEVIRSAGGTMVAVEKPLSDATLAGADALVISGAFAPPTPDEVEAIMRFMQRGGKLSVMLHIAPPLRPLLERLKVTYTNGVILERENIIDDQPTNFKVNRLENHPVLQGLTDFSLYGVWGLLNQDDSTRIIAATSRHAWIDLHHNQVQTSDETASFGVAVAGEVGKGGFLVFGDDAIFQNKFLEGNNSKLALNLAKWFGMDIKQH
jgi:hypothetical protein